MDEDKNRKTGKQEKRKLTSRNLPHPPLPNSKPRGRCANLNLDPAVEYKEDHLHLPAILASFRPAWWEIDHAGSEEWHRKGLREPEFGAGDVAHLDGIVGIGDFCMQV